MSSTRTIRWHVLFIPVFFLLFLLWTATPYAFGCTNSTGDAAPCVVLAQGAATDTSTPTVTTTAQSTPTLSATATITPTATLRPTSTAVPTPNGDSPATARLPMWVKPEYCIEQMCPGAINAPLLNSPGGWDWIPGKSSIWYAMDDGHSLQVQMWVFANGQQGLALDVYAPEQTDLYGTPVGRGALNRNYPGADLFYSGRTSAYGIWYARLTNNNAFPVYYSMRYTRTTPNLNNVCDECHKSIGYDWGSCPDPAFCGKLHDYYDTNPLCYDHNIENDLAGGCK